MRVAPTILIALYLCLGIAPTQASECFSPSPLKKKSGQTFEEIKPVKLTNTQASSIRNMFKNLRGNWRGTATGFFCLGTEKSPRQKADNFTIKAEIDVFSQQDIVITADMDAIEQRKQRTEIFRLFSSNGFLRLNKNRTAGDVKVKTISQNEISFVQYSQIKINSKGPSTTTDAKNTVNKSGGIARREIITTIKRSYKALRIEYKVYSNGVLSSTSTWSLKKR
ncbi:hypothetical protein [Zooshikella ganghwensis]|uniref:Uncharacterized protein n=1 Tax=Zooshikella ganghwensis TaxID=202772 RepID=A0A4P9VKW8_9GAMM|nr:hypothetical protein [Zooshikella ganghwensis]RDH43965.1 hypothetical protein B9G39_11200 [Zooshikella ganghwensis]